MHFEKQGGFFIDGFLVIGWVRSIGAADLFEDRPAFGHDLRNSERTPDLDQLSAGDDDFSAVRKGVEGQEHGRGVVVYHRRRLGACEFE